MNKIRESHYESGDVHGLTESASDLECMERGLREEEGSDSTSAVMRSYAQVPEPFQFFCKTSDVLDNLKGSVQL